MFEHYNSNIVDKGRPDMTCSKDVKASCNFSKSCFIAKAVRGAVHNDKTSISPSSKVKVAKDHLNVDIIEGIKYVDNENTMRSLRKKFKTPSFISSDHSHIEGKQFYRRRLDQNGIEIKDQVFFATDESLNMLKNCTTLFCDSTFKSRISKSGMRFFLLNFVNFC